LPTSAVARASAWSKLNRPMPLNAAMTGTPMHYEEALAAGRISGPRSTGSTPPIPTDGIEALTRRRAIGDGRSATGDGVTDLGSALRRMASATHSRSDQTALRPPSTSRTAPWTKLAPSPAR
jgi:hypothetical protein